MNINERLIEIAKQQKPVKAHDMIVYYDETGKLRIDFIVDDSEDEPKQPEA